MPVRAYYHSDITTFLSEEPERLLGILTAGHHHALEEPQRWAWTRQVPILKQAFVGLPDGHIFLEFFIPRMGKRADAVLVAQNIVVVIEFKVGADKHTADALDQVEDYALDLKNFHEGSHGASIVPILVSTNAEPTGLSEVVLGRDNVARPIATNAIGLGGLLQHVLASVRPMRIDFQRWMAQGYRPTPTIVEAAQVLYRTHSVSDIARFDAGAINLQQTSEAVSFVIDKSRKEQRKSICFLTGVPGSGKTLAGLNIATRRSEDHVDEHAVFLSGNGPLVAVLREALARDKAGREGISKKAAEREVNSFIQNIHHFRDDALGNEVAPVEKVVVFDEAQRAWTQRQTANFMKRKRGQDNFEMSEPEFLLSVMDRHRDWCTVVCLVGEGQEINTGEAGIGEWIKAVEEHFSDWEVYISPRFTSQEESDVQKQFLRSERVHITQNLHLAVSIRSFRAEALSEFVGHIVDSDAVAAQICYSRIKGSYPIALSRNLEQVRAWLREQSRGTERIGLVASSGALRLRPDGIHMKAEVDPPNWFLNDRFDVRSSWYLEEVASEFDVQGLELDWVGVCWDGDFHHTCDAWQFRTFSGSRWNAMNDPAKKEYLRNAYRVLLTRSRQGLIIYIPRVDGSDPTRPSDFYDGTYAFLQCCGIPALD